MGGRLVVYIVLALSLAVTRAGFAEPPAQSTHANANPNSQASADAGSSARDQTPQASRSSEDEARRKLLNGAADADPSLSEGRRALQSAAESFWGSLDTDQQAGITAELAGGKSEKLDTLLKEKGLVLSSPEKREKFLQNFGIQLAANAKRGSSEGISELIASANREPKGDPLKRQQQLAAKEALQTEIGKNRAAVDFLTRNLGWTAQDSLLAVRRVEEQSKLLASGTPKQKAAAQDYLYRIFGPVYGVGMRNADKPSNAITELFSDAALRDSEFGKIGRPFITAGMGQNFTSKENPYGACAGVECARDFIADALVRSAMKGDGIPAAQAVEQFEKEKTLPRTLKTDEGAVVPTISDKGIQTLADIYTKYDNGWLYSEKEKIRSSTGLKDFYEVDRVNSFKNQQELNAFFDRPEVKANSGATIWVSRKTPVTQPDGTTKEVVSGHVVTLSRLGNSQTYLVRDPNIKGLAYDARIDPTTGRFTYSYSGPDGKSTTFEWDNFFPSPNFWQTASK